MSNKRLFKDSKDKKVSGVLSGVAKYFGFDPNILRLVYTLAVVFTGFFPLIVMYFVADWILPLDSDLDKPANESQPEKRLDL